jgi:hypothetical protein
MAAKAMKRAVSVSDIYRVDRSAVERQLGHPIRTLSPSSGRGMKALPAKVKRTGMRQLCVSLGEAQAKELERIRVESGLRSWNQVIRMLIADAMVRRAKAE